MEQEGIAFFDLGVRFGWAVLTPAGRVFSGETNLNSSIGGPPALRWARFRAEVAPIFCGWMSRISWGYELFRGNFQSRDAVLMLFGLEAGLLEVAAVYSTPKPVTLAPTSLKKWATGSGKAEKSAMIAEAMRRWSVGKVGDNEADALLGLAWLMSHGTRTEAFPLRSRQPSIASIVGSM